MEVTLRRQRLRCALCHDEAVGHLVRCRFCGVFMHTECKAEFGRCPSLGCVASAPPLPPLPPPVVIEVSEEPPEPGPGLWRRARLFSATLILAALLPLLLCQVMTWVPDPVRVRAANQAKLRADAKAIGDALKLHRVESGRWARSLDALGVEGSRGPYLDGPPYSPWGERYRLAWDERRAYLLARDGEGRLLATLVLER